MTDTEVRMCDCLRTCAGVCVGVGVKKKLKQFTCTQFYSKIVQQFITTKVKRNSNHRINPFLLASHTLTMYA